MEEKKSSSSIRQTTSILRKLKEANVLNTDAKLSEVLTAIETIEDPMEKVAGYVIAWDKYGLVVKKDLAEEININPAVNR